MISITLINAFVLNIFVGLFIDCKKVNPKIKTNICGLRDWLLDQGRHFEIRMLMTNHLLMNYGLVFYNHPLTLKQV